MTPSRLADIQARVDAASKAPWSANLEEENCFFDGENRVIMYPEWDDAALLCASDEDVEFICAARTDIPDLLAEVRRLTEKCNAQTGLENAVRTVGKEREDALLKRVDRLTAQLAAETRRADAAIADMRLLVRHENPCATCDNKYCMEHEDDDEAICCLEDENDNHWEWRGLCAENAPSGAESGDPDGQ
jgi:hypothetical protein